MSTSIPSVAFIICTEKGLLENKSLLFARSLRKFGGALKDATIYSLAPRKGKDISKNTRDAFKVLKVTHEYHDLNKQYKDYDFANKIVACTYFEQELTEEILIFCDSDQLVLGDLSEFLLDTEELAMQYVAIKGIGSNGEDENAFYWKRLYELCQIKEPSYISLQDGQSIYQYFNAGLIVAKRGIGLFKKWSYNFDLLMKKGIEPPKGKFFIEQSVLSATISAMALSVKVLPEAYNYHLLKHTRLNEALHKIDNGEIKLLHYHNAFDQEKKHELPKSLNLKKSIKLNWLNEELKKLGFNKKPFIPYMEAEFRRNEDKIRSVIKAKMGKADS